MMNVSVDANDRHQVLELWKQYQLSRKQPGDLFIFADPPMRGPDDRNLAHFFSVPEDFAQLLDESDIPYTAR
jgi:hypothetical protein